MHAGLLPRAPLSAARAPVRVRLRRPSAALHQVRPDAAMTEIARAAMPGVAVQDAVWLQDYDGYYYDPRGSPPLPVLRVRYADAYGTWLYLDPERGGIVAAVGHGSPGCGDGCTRVCTASTFRSSISGGRSGTSWSSS